MTELTETPDSNNRSIPIWLPVLAVMAILMVVASHVYMIQRFQDFDGTLSEVKTALATEIADLRSHSEMTSASSVQTIDSLRNQLEAARRESVQGVQQARAARQHADKLAKSLAEQQQKQQEMVATELTEVKQSAHMANEKLVEVSTDVGNVRTEVASTKTELERTIADLKRVTGDLGVMSGLIATNAGELKALKELGDRHYYNFELTKTKKPQRVGDILVQVRKTDTRRNRFTIDVIADDKKTEKKERTVNEPVQFYVPSKARQPYELVVNEVHPNRLVGYLAAPKMQVARQ
jgi:chromosome segregation ATPase